MKSKEPARCPYVKPCSKDVPSGLKNHLAITKRPPNSAAPVRTVGAQPSLTSGCMAKTVRVGSEGTPGTCPAAESQIQTGQTAGGAKSMPGGVFRETLSTLESGNDLCHASSSLHSRSHQCPERMLMGALNIIDRRTSSRNQGLLLEGAQPVLVSIRADGGGGNFSGPGRRSGDVVVLPDGHRCLRHCPTSLTHRSLTNDPLVRRSDCSVAGT
jgi:hypothetical protein